MAARLLLVVIIFFLVVPTVAAETQIVSNCPQENVFAGPPGLRSANNKVVVPTQERCCLLCVAALPIISAFSPTSLRPAVVMHSFQALVAIDPEPLKRPPKGTF
jgi:hypothetical protein